VVATRFREFALALRSPRLRPPGRRRPRSEDQRAAASLAHPEPPAAVPLHQKRKAFCRGGNCSVRSSGRPVVMELADRRASSRTQCWGENPGCCVWEASAPAATVVPALQFIRHPLPQSSVLSECLALSLWSLGVAHGGVGVSSCSCGLTACTSTLGFLVVVWQFSYIIETKKYVCSTQN
ncbi:hypothetical protein LEMLEM_LOCUS27862, partial [Lemmus lemmus]